MIIIAIEEVNHKSFVQTDIGHVDGLRRKILCVNKSTFEELVSKKGDKKLEGICVAELIWSMALNDDDDDDDDEDDPKILNPFDFLL